jgi:hypothetical protein
MVLHTYNGWVLWYLPWNLCFHRTTWEKITKPTVEDNLAKWYRWDEASVNWLSAESMERRGQEALQCRAFRPPQRSYYRGQGRVHRVQVRETLFMNWWLHTHNLETQWMPIFPFSELCRTFWLCYLFWSLFSYCFSVLSNSWLQKHAFLSSS